MDPRCILFLNLVFGVTTFGTIAQSSRSNAAPSIAVVSKPYTNIAHVFGDSGGVLLSGDGNWAAFSSNGSGLVTNDNKGLNLDAFLQNLNTGARTLISPTTSGGRATGNSVPSGISEDGRFVLLESDADGLVEGDTNGSSDVFLYEGQTGKLDWITAGANGESGGSFMTKNGRFVLFESTAENLDPSDHNGGTDLFLLDRESGTVKLVTLNADNSASAAGPNIPSQIGTFGASVSEDGRYVAYLSGATNATITPVPKNGVNQLFVRDMVARTNIWVLQSDPQAKSLAVTAPELSTNGMVLAFISFNLASGPSDQRLRIYSVSSNLLSTVPAAPGTTTLDPIQEFSLSANGKVVLYSRGGGVYRYDLVTGIALQLGYPDGTPLAGAGSSVVSDDGNIGVFQAQIPGDSTGPVQLYAYRSDTGKVTLLTPDLTTTNGGDRDILFPVLSNDGMRVGFMSFATDLVENDDKNANDAFWVSTSGSEPAHLISTPDPSAVSATALGASELSINGISDDGRFVVFSSLASDLVPNDHNQQFDVFRQDLRSGRTKLVSISPDGVSPFPANSTFLSMSRDGQFIAFASTNLSTAGVGSSVYVYDASSGTNRIGSILPDGSPITASYGNLSADGRYLGFRVEVNPGNGSYVRDLQTGQSFPIQYLYSPFPLVPFSGVSPAGGYFVILSSGLSLIDWRTNRTITISGNNFGNVQFTADDSNLLFTGNISFAAQNLLYLYSTTQKTSNVLGTNVAFASISADGSTVAMTQTIPGGSHLVIRDLTGGNVSPVPFPQAVSNFRLRSRPVLSRDGRFVTFVSANDVLGGATNKDLSDIFLYDRVLTNLTLISHSTDGGYRNGGSSQPAISANGRMIAFQSNASDLVANDRNSSSDVFVASVLAVDTDGDGLEDGWELIHFGNLGANPQDDADGDGVSNLAEFQSGTDPKNSTSIFSLGAPVMGSDGQLELSWSAVPGMSYQVQFRPTLTGGVWTNVGQPIMAFSGELQSSLPHDSAGSGFFRVTVAP